MAAAERAQAAFFVPGNHQALISYEGVPIHEHPRIGQSLRPFDGHPVLLTRIDERDGTVSRSLLPVAGHDVTIRPDGLSAVCNGQNGTTMCTFHPETLEMGAFLEYPEGTLGGGHSVYLPDRATQAVTERVPYERWSGKAEYHYGWVTIRDNDSLQQLERYSSGGITPHDINLLEDGKHVAVANYGSTNWPEGYTGFDRYIVEPSLAVLELASGKIVERFVSKEANAEWRHLSALNLERIFVLQNAEMSLLAFHELMKGSDRPYWPKLSRSNFSAGAPRPIVHLDFHAPSQPRRDLMCDDPVRMMRGQSIRYDPVHDEVIATFPGSESVVAISAKTGAAKVIDCASLGLSLPRGLDLHPDGRHYVVAGDEANVFVFERGSHRLIRQRCYYTRLFRHSHMTVA